MNRLFMHVRHALKKLTRRLRVELLTTNTADILYSVASNPVVAILVDESLKFRCSVIWM